jgi:transposase InsO family protein
MRKRIHSSLGYLTPSEYEMKWNEQKQDNYDIKEEPT